MRIPCLILVLLIFCQSVVKADRWLFKDGRSDYAIVLPADASVSELTAAEEFRDMIYKMGGVLLPIIDNDGAAAKHVYVGYSEWGHTKLGVKRPEKSDEGYCYRTMGDDLFIYGGSDRGTMYGVYSFLEHEMGVRWYTSTYTKIPKKKFFSLDNVKGEEHPAIRQRLDFYFDALAHREFAAHNLLNTQYEIVNNRYGHFTAYWKAHTFQILIPPSVYFEQHPEYFSVHDGRRTDNAQLCLSNSMMRKELIKNLKKAIAGNPDYWCYDVSQNDNQLPCECAACQRLVRKYGGQSGAMIWFVNQVAEEIARVYPDVYIGTFAYQYTRHAPTSTIRPAKNVVVRLCDVECCMAHPLEGCELNRSFVNDFSEWRKKTENIYIWDYTTSFMNYLLPFPNFDVLASNIRYFSRNNVIGVMEEGAHNTFWNEFSELKQWMLAKLLWNPYQDTDSLTKMFIDDYYGKAAPYVRQYYDLCRSLVNDKVHFTIQLDWNSPLYSDKFISSGIAILDDAQQQVVGDDEITKRVKRLSAQVYYLKIRRSPVKSRLDGTLDAFKQIVGSDEALIGESNYKLDDMLKDLDYY